MKLTEKHIKDSRITKLIEYVENAAPAKISEELILALLELKQRRSEDRLAAGAAGGLCKTS